MTIAIDGRGEIVVWYEPGRTFHVLGDDKIRITFPHGWYWSAVPTAVYALHVSPLYAAGYEFYIDGSPEAKNVTRSKPRCWGPIDCDECAVPVRDWRKGKGLIATPAPAPATERCAFASGRRIDHPLLKPETFRPELYDAAASEQFNILATRMEKHAKRVLRETPLCRVTGEHAGIAVRSVGLEAELFFYCKPCED